MSPGSSLRLWLRPGLLGLHVFAVAAIAFCVFMGLWQMGVYDARQEHERADRRNVPVVDFDGLWGPDEPFEAKLNHRPVTVAGEFAPAADQFWVSGRKQGNQTGFWLVAPFVVAGGDEALLVVRGWSPQAGALPEVPVVTDIGAVLEPGEESGTPLNDDRVTGTLRIPALLNVLPYDLYSGFAISTSPSTAEGLVLADPPQPETSWSSGMRNLMYAFQWWVFGLFALFMWWRMSTESVTAAKRKVA